MRRIEHVFQPGILPQSMTSYPNPKIRRLSDSVFLTPRDFEPLTLAQHQFDRRRRIRRAVSGDMITPASVADIAQSDGASLPFGFRARLRPSSMVSGLVRKEPSGYTFSARNRPPSLTVPVTLFKTE
jgi:hypothetical protein